MPINPNILLQGQVADIGKAVSQGLEVYQQGRRNVLLEEQQKREAETTRISNALNLQKMQVQGAALAAQRALPYLQSGDMAGLKTFVQGTNLLDDQDKAEFSAKIDANDLQGILGDVSGAIGMAQQMGIFTAPKEATDTRTSIEKNLEAAGLEPGSPEFRAAVMQQLTKPSGTQVSIQMPGQQGLTEEAKALGKVRAERFQAIQNQGDSASTTLDSLSQLYTLNTQTGLGEQTKADIAGVLNAVGVRGDDLLNVDTANVESANKIISKLVAEAMTNQKGVASESDRALYANIAPSIKDKQQAYKFNIASTSAVAQRQVDKSNFYNDWFEQNGNLVGVDKAWSNYTKSTPLFQRGVVGFDGLPQNYYQFRDAFLQIPANSGAPEEDIKQQWLLAPKVLKKQRGGL
jgi:hypothetical protein